ncbi:MULTISPECIES: hypothetical protein [Bradyrhizobium]|uniref:Uncharacterized protein n=1 Tax=Bradyrhizobium septentrionale TaxID=1404411 RepID=A0ABZ2P958_9BRAD
MTKKRKRQQQDGNAMIDDLLTDCEMREANGQLFREVLARARREPVQSRSLVLAEHPTLQ